MDLVSVTRIVAWIGLALGLVGILLRLREIMRRPFKKDYSRGRGSDRRGILYAFTLGMAPWEKESTRQHWVAYLRGIFFHLGVFTAFGVFLVSPWLEALPPLVLWIAGALTAAGAMFGFAGIAMRLMGENERALSLPDDYFSVFLTSLFTALACAVLVWPGLLPFFYLVTALLCVYVPFGKIRHCVYFFYSKFFFGKNFGHRGVLGPDNQKAME
jgi:nitrate reductase gamma subunit